MSWLTFSYAAIVSLAIIYIPGILFIRAFRFSWIASFITAPLISGFWYLVLGVFLDIAKIGISSPMLFLIVLFIGFGVYVVVSVIKWVRVNKGNRRSGESRSEKTTNDAISIAFVSENLPDTSKSWLLLLAYVILGIIIASYVYLGGIEDPDTFSRWFDSAYHYSCIRSFEERGVFSILNASVFPEIESAGAFYPALWHIYVAVVDSISGLGIPACSNAVIFIGLSFLLPTGLFGLLNWLFRDNYIVIISGCVMPLAFVGYPWGNLIYGQLTSNYFANTLIFASFLLFMIFLKSLFEKRSRLLCVSLFSMSIVSLAGTQPNAVFTVGILCLLYIIRIYAEWVFSNEWFKRKKIWAFSGCVTIFVVGCGVWALCFQVPLIEHIALANDNITYEFPDSLLKGCVLAFAPRIQPQYVLAALCWIGFFTALFTKGRRWLCAAYIAGFVIYIISSSTTGSLPHYISGFWYNDVFRTSAIVCLFAMPLAAYGMAIVAKLILFIVNKIIKRENVTYKIQTIICFVLCLIFLPVNFLLATPNVFAGDNSENAFDVVKKYLHDFYSWDTNYIISKQQYEFLQEAKEVVAEDPGLIMNMPFDGSGWMYGADGLNVMYRTAWGPTGSLLDSEILRNRIDDYAESEEVQSAIEDSDVKYILRLVSSDNGKPIVKTFYDSDEWKGYDSLDDDTLGFEVVLSEGNMRLYKVIRG